MVGRLVLSVLRPADPSTVCAGCRLRQFVLLSLESGIENVLGTVVWSLNGLVGSLNFGRRPVLDRLE